MTERPRQRIVVAAILSAACLAAISGCDNTVNIKTLTLQLRELHPIGAGYTTKIAAGEKGASCEVNTDTFDLKVLLLGNTKQRELTLVREGDRLEHCTFSLDKDDDSACALNRDSVRISTASVELLSSYCEREDDGLCDAYGDGWSCQTTDRLCQSQITLSMVPVGKRQDVDFVTNGKVEEGEAVGRIIALVIDNSGSLRGNTSPPCPVGATTCPVPLGATPTDPNDDRIAAATAFVGSLEANDRVAVYALSGEGDVAGVVDVSEGFFAPGSAKVNNAIEALSASEADGTPIWDGVVRAARDIRAHADLDKFLPSVVMFTDGYRKQDKARDEGATEEYGNLPPPAGATYGDALDAVQSDEHPIPVFIVHLENVDAVRTAFGRDADLSDLACGSGGAYYRVERPGDVKMPFEKFFKYATVGHYRLRIGYQSLAADRYPAGEDYAINASINLTLDKNEQSFELKRGMLRGRAFDSRVFVHKPELGE